MNKDQQTVEVIKNLYDLTYKFTRSLVGHYYYQYRGDIEDLASDFFTSFLTPKASKGNEKQTLLDKFDPSVTSLPYLVKVCVIRKLIDASRANPSCYISIDALIEKKGDFMVRVFDLIEKDDEQTRLSDPQFIKKIEEGFKTLDEDVRNHLFVELFDSGSSLRTILKPVIKMVRECPLQQVTDKTAVLLIPLQQTFVNFSLEDGCPRSSFRPFRLNNEELIRLRAMAPYHSQFSKELFLEYFMSA